MLRAVSLLQARPFRSVSVETRHERSVVVKRFHHASPLRSPFDRRRAERELAALEAFARAGLPVPRPLELRRGSAGHELVLERIESARSLDELWRAGLPPPFGWPRLLVRLGRLLARLQTSGWEHGDLHPGNVLVDGRGEPWLIDLQRARPAPTERTRLFQELVECAAWAREALSPRQRLRFLVAWLAALPEELHPALERSRLLTVLEARARARRAELVVLGLGRWTRPSSRVRAVRWALAAGWERRLPATEGGTDWLVLRATPEEVRARWLGAARLLEHGLPAARPALYVPAAGGSRAAWAGFEIPPASLLAANDAALERLLADRGLALRSPAVARAEGGVYLLPPREPEDFAFTA
jgi:hypothetical protein